jgi:fluoroacetyl-CoA thioesterase
VASRIGMHIKILVELSEVDGRRLVFDVTATDKYDTSVCTGTIERVVVDRDAFLSDLPG